VSTVQLPGEFDHWNRPVSSGALSGCAGRSGSKKDTL
jgi:hypothetical protein